MSCEWFSIVGAFGGALLGVVCLRQTAWSCGLGTRLSARKARPSASGRLGAHTWELRSQEQTSGERIGVYRCLHCGDLERRVLDAD